MEVWILRIVHIGAGVVWAGYGIFAAWFLFPAVWEAGPAAGAVMGALMKRKLPQMITMFGTINVLSGLRLYSIYFNGNWLMTGTGILLTLGGISAIISLIYGILVSRPTALRLGALGAEVRAAGGAPSPEQAGEMKKLNATMKTAVLVNAYTLGFTVLCMAASRFVPF
jgi:uncharacterized membrane protein